MWNKIKRLLSDTDKPEQQPTATKPAPARGRIRKYRIPGPRERVTPPKRTDGIIPPLTPPPKSDRAEKAS